MKNNDVSITPQFLIVKNGKIIKDGVIEVEIDNNVLKKELSVSIINANEIINEINLILYVSKLTLETKKAYQNMIEVLSRLKIKHGEDIYIVIPVKVNTIPLIINFLKDNLKNYITTSIGSQLIIREAYKILTEKQQRKGIK